jgi:hypothetical protein
MATIANTARWRGRVTSRIGLRPPLWALVLCSRLVVLASGAYGVLVQHRVNDWTSLDPQRLSSSFGSVGNVLTATTFRWDSLRYIEVAHHGYTTADSTLAFPLYPLLIRAVTVVVRVPVVAGVLVSVIAFAVGLALVHRIASEEISPRAADTAVLLLAFAPLSFVFSAVYTESLLLALSAGALYLARRGQFVLGCIVASGAALTHSWGILLVAPLALVYWNNRGRPRELRRLWSPSALALALPAIALLGFFAYLHARGFGWLAPITSQDNLYAGRRSVGTPVTLFLTAKHLVLGLTHLSRGLAGAGVLAPGIQNLNDLCLFLISVMALVSGWRRLPKEYVLAAALVLLFCTSSAVDGTEPLKGFGRYLLPIFPLWIGAAAWIEERRLTTAVLTVSTVLLVIYATLFARWVAVF